MARLVASHLACSISVFKSPSEMVNLLLISYHKGKSTPSAFRESLASLAMLAID